ncbi:YtcA family lipoprotein [Advenella sp. EE-W14]|uniref:YtcA family lipoprotein n=1 Tax=Advenella sp. EE-W14 TaxID=2722705 RepID=UPI0020070E36|nr:YtcA family lipoprotein [Advenella sp. EE-W14]
MMPRIVMLWLVAAMLSGCSNAPSVYAFGSYFPSWLLCAFIGIIGAVLVRVVFVYLQLDDVLPLRLLVYLCVALIIAIVTSLSFFST